jgi:poly(A) polymerase
MVKYHLRPVQLSNEGLPSNRAIYRYFRDTGDAGVDVLYLSLADHLAARGPYLKEDQWREHARVVDYVLTQRFEQENVILPPRLIDGNDLMNIFGMSPGPEIGELLEMVREGQAAGEITTKEGALSLIYERLSDRVRRYG